MKKACLVLVLLTSLIACEKTSSPDIELDNKRPVKSITATSSAGNYTVTLTYSGDNQLISYAPSNGLPSFKFTYNSNGLPSVIEETIGNKKTEYTIYYTNDVPDWSSSRIMQNNTLTDGPDYEYAVSNGNVIEVSQFIKGSAIKTGSVTAEYERHFMNKITSNIIGNSFSRSYTYSRLAAVNTSKRINLLTPNMPAHLVSMFVADKEVNGTVETTFTYGY